MEAEMKDDERNRERDGATNAQENTSFLKREKCQWVLTGKAKGGTELKGGGGETYLSNR